MFRDEKTRVGTFNIICGNVVIMVGDLVLGMFIKCARRGTYRPIEMPSDITSTHRSTAHSVLNPQLDHIILPHDLNGFWKVRYDG